MRDSKGRFVSWTVDEFRVEFAKYGLINLRVWDDQYGNVIAYAKATEKEAGIPPYAQAHVFTRECDRDLGRKSVLACERLLEFVRVIGGVR